MGPFSLLALIGGAAGGYHYLNGKTHGRVNDMVVNKVEQAVDFTKECSGEDGVVTNSLNTMQDYYNEWTAPRDNTRINQSPSEVLEIETDPTTTTTTDSPAKTNDPKKKEEEDFDAAGWGEYLTGKFKNMGMGGKVAAGAAGLFTLLGAGKFMANKTGIGGGAVWSMAKWVLGIGALLGVGFLVKNQFKKASGATPGNDPKTELQRQYADANTRGVKLEDPAVLNSIQKQIKENLENGAQPNSPELEAEAGLYADPDGVLHEGPLPEEVVETNTGFNHEANVPGKTFAYTDVKHDPEEEPGLHHDG